MSCHEFNGRNWSSFSQESSSMLSHKALSVGNLKGDRKRRKKNLKMLFRGKNHLINLMRNHLSNGVLNWKTVLVCANLHLCAQCHQRDTSSEGQGADEPEKRQMRCYSKATWVQVSPITAVCHCGFRPVDSLTEWVQKLCYAKSSVLWDSGKEHWVKAAIETSPGIQPTLWSHPQWDDTANRKAHSAALFQAATQQPQRGPDRSICQTQLWRNPVSCNISESRHQLSDSFLPDRIHKGSMLTRHY